MSFGNVKHYGNSPGLLTEKWIQDVMITDIELAPRNSRGMAEYSIEFPIAKPIDMTVVTGPSGCEISG
jgi:hypothetical protein